jgi:hypothetical protein
MLGVGREFVVLVVAEADLEILGARVTTGDPDVSRQRRVNVARCLRLFGGLRLSREQSIMFGVSMDPAAISPPGVGVLLHVIFSWWLSAKVNLTTAVRWRFAPSQLALGGRRHRAAGCRLRMILICHDHS